MYIHRKLNEYLNNTNKDNYNNIIDYTRTSDNLTNDDIKIVCKDAEINNYYSVCILPKYTTMVYSFLRNKIKVSTLIDFPGGEKSTKEKINEINNAIVNGTNEVDVVINYKLIKNIEYHDDLSKEIRDLSEYCHKENVIIKVIIELGSLNYQEIETICGMCVDGNVDYIMTSTGKLPNDNTFEEKLEKVKVMRKILPDEIGIKFSGGIRNLDQIKDIKNYVDRIGTSSIIK